MDLTLLEVHLDDSTFTANAPFSSDEAQIDADDGDAGEGGGRPVIPFLAGLVGLALLAYLVRRFRSGGSTAVPEVEPTATESEPEVASP